MAGMAQPDNFFGSAGPAGPIAALRLVSSPSPDFFSYIEYLIDVIGSLAAGNQIINISAGVHLPAIACLAVCDTLDGITGLLRSTGSLIFAPAGNHGQNVDETDSFLGVTWESGSDIPCEDSGVICVGGLGWNSKSKAQDSNWGSASSDPNASNTVTMFGPYDVWNWSGGCSIVDCPDSPVSPGIYLEHGTSYASPFVAGVAALVWAANPALNADQVQNILFTTAHLSPDPKVPRYVNAFAAVKSALGGHVPPNIFLESPADGTTYHLGDEISFHAIAVNGDDLSNVSNLVQWSSNTPADAPFSTGSYFFPQHDLSVGQHDITASITISGYTQTASVRINVVDTPITVNIVQPYSGQNFFVNDSIPLFGDALHHRTRLPVSQLRWAVVDNPAHPLSLGSGVPGGGSSCGATSEIASCLMVSAASLGQGVHRISFTATDAGLSASAVTEINIRAQPICAPPQVSILAPAPGATFDAYLVGSGGPGGQIPEYEVFPRLTLQGEATDRHGNVVNDLTWYQEAVAGGGIGHGAILTGSRILVHLRGTTSDPVSVPIFLVARDWEYATAQAGITIRVVTHDSARPQ
jgi:hypothetical protein